MADRHGPLEVVAVEATTETSDAQIAQSVIERR